VRTVTDLKPPLPRSCSCCLYNVDPDSPDNIAVEGTEKMCEDLGVSLDDVVLLAIAYECKSPGVGEWGRKEWVEGWRKIGYVSLSPLSHSVLSVRSVITTREGRRQHVLAPTN
jgi:hypothetical protein